MTKTTPSKLAAVYVRISQDREGEELGVDRQRVDCVALAKRLGLQVYKLYPENDTGASTRSRKARPVYDQMLADAEAGLFKTIIAYTSSRLTRRPLEHEAQIRLAEQYRIKFKFVASPSFDLNTADGRQVARILAANDAGYSEGVGEKVARARKARQEEGRFGGGSRPFGFEPDGVTVRASEAAEIVKATEAILTGVSLRAVVQDLRARDVPTATGKGKWIREGIKSILLRARNAGIAVYHGEEVGKASWDPIVPEDQWRAVVAKLTDPGRKTSPGPAPRWLLSGIAKCGRCGAPMYTATTARRRLNPVYVCSVLRHLVRNVEALDAYIIDVVVERCSAPDAADLITTPSSGVDLAALRAERKALRERKEGLVDTYMSGGIDKAELNRGLQRPNARLAEIKGELAAATELSPLSPLIGVEDVGAAWNDLSLGHQRRVIERLMTITVLPTARGVRTVHKRGVVREDVRVEPRV